MAFSHRLLPAFLSHWSAVIFALALTILFSGCRSAAYQAHQLPNQYRSQEAAHTRPMNLAGVSVPGSSSALLAVGDLLEVSVSTGREDEKQEPMLARIANDGTVNIPVIGPVPVAGMEAYDASQSITRLAVERGIYHHPVITVQIKTKAVNRITVVGAVSEPGVHELPRGNCDLISALAASGGMTEEAGTEVEIIRQPSPGLAQADAPATTIDSQTPMADSEIQLAAYQNLGPQQRRQARSSGWSVPQTLRVDLAERGSRTPNEFVLKDRDVVRVVPRKKDVIHVAGLVNEPGQFELPRDQSLHLVDAIALAGGRSSPVADKVLVIRRLADREEPLAIQASLAAAKQDGRENLRLMAGDSISLEQTPSTALIDAMTRFFRLSFGVASNAVF